MQKISIVIPARNEEKYISKCLASAHAAAERIELPIEIVVVLNRCTDATAGIAARYHAITVTEEARNLARIRNTGIRSAGGDVIVTSCRKFDQFGDWYLFRNPRLVKEIFGGRNQEAADRFYYDAGR